MSAAGRSGETGGMKNCRHVRSAPTSSRGLRCGIALALASVGTSTLAQFSTGQAADVVLGQPTFTAKFAGPAPSGFVSPSGIAVDPATGKVFVSLAGTNCVVRYVSAQAAISGNSAEAALGQPAFGSESSGHTRSTMDSPHGLCVDSSGRLWVADSSNNRVLGFNAAILAAGANASVVLGQSSFTANTGGHTATTLSYPTAVAIDDSGNLWVADLLNSRMLRFNAADLGTSGAAAKVVLGQASFTENAGYFASQNTVGSPVGLCADAEGALYVADNGALRVLRFDGAATMPDNTAMPNAAGVIGQPNFGFRDIKDRAHGIEKKFAPSPAGAKAWPP